MRVSSNGSNRIIAEGSFDGEDWSQIAGADHALGEHGSRMKFGLKVVRHRRVREHARCSTGSASTARTACRRRRRPRRTGRSGRSARLVQDDADGDADGRRGRWAGRHDLYRIDGGDAGRTYDEPFTVAGQGDHMVEYFAIDEAEEPNTETIKTHGAPRRTARPA